MNCCLFVIGVVIVTNGPEDFGETEIWTLK